MALIVGPNCDSFGKVLDEDSDVAGRAGHDDQQGGSRRTNENEKKIDFLARKNNFLCLTVRRLVLLEVLDD